MTTPAPPLTAPAAPRRGRGPARRRGVLRGVLAPALLAAGAGTAVGVRTSYAQGWLPEEVAPLANSSTSWCVIAALLALAARSAPAGALAATVALLSLNAGYGVGSELRGYVHGTEGLASWSLAAVVAGPPVGAAVHWVRQRRLLGPPAAGVLAGVVAGEGAYGVLALADVTPYGPYYGVQLALGVVGLAWACVRLRRPAGVVVAVAAAAAVAVAVVVVHGDPQLLSPVVG